MKKYPSPQPSPTGGEGAFEKNFWREYQRFLKTPLITETPNPRTAELSTLAQKDFAQALHLLFALDIDAINQFTKINLTHFKKTIDEVLKNQGRIFLVGCGASGRMAMQIESLWQNPDQVKAIIAGGDIALIEAVEGCEDVPEFAVRHLQTINLSTKDLVIGLSAGGESPFILGALEYALKICERKPWLLYCNPAEILLLRNPGHILKKCNDLCLHVGPMALTGSTRMQATTVMTLALLTAFFSDEVSILIDKINHLPWNDLAQFVEFETRLYQEDKKVLYVVESPYGLSVLADTTERSPTFNVATFEHGKGSMALAYMIVKDSQNKREALEKILLRAPQALNWPELSQTDMHYLEEFDLSEAYQSKREEVYVKEVDNKVLIIYAQKHFIELDVSSLSLGFKQLLLRLVLVNHSTLVFGRLGFYQGNLMTFVRPSNFKLVDRAVRYIQFLAEVRYQKKLDYKKVAEEVLKLRDTLPEKTSIVEQGLKFFCK